jgi:hypothetical protein
MTPDEEKFTLIKTAINIRCFVSKAIDKDIIKRYEKRIKRGVKKRVTRLVERNVQDNLEQTVEYKRAIRRKLEKLSMDREFNFYNQFKILKEDMFTCNQLEDAYNSL